MAGHAISAHGPLGLDRLVFIDAFAHQAWSMDQHSAEVHELFDVERSATRAQASCPLDVDGAVEFVVFAGEVEIGGKMTDACNGAAMLLPQRAERPLDLPVGG
jgi:hypothetical protein